MVPTFAVAAVARSIADVVRAQLESSRGAIAEGVGVRLLGSAEMRAAGNEPMLGVFVHRVEPQPSLGRNLSARTVEHAGEPRTPLVLHLLLVAIAPTGDEELDLLELGIQALAAEPLLTSRRLRPHARDWPEERAVQLTLEALAPAELARIWSALAAPSWLAAAYTARLQ